MTKKFFKAKVTTMGKKQRIITVPKDDHDDFVKGDKVIVTKEE